MPNTASEPHVRATDTDQRAGAARRGNWLQRYSPPACGISEAWGLTGILRGVFRIESVRPVAVVSDLLAARYVRHPQDAAGTVLVSTRAWFLMLPALLLFAISRPAP